MTIKGILVGDIKDINKYIREDMFKPHGETVTLFRRNGFSYSMQLSGIRSLEIECAEQAQINPGTIRIENEKGNVIWSEETRH
jgi:hypothetical protein